MSTPIPTPTVAAPAPRKSRRLVWYLGGFVLLMVATPTAVYFYLGWSGTREMAEIEREIDETDPRWRWPDLVADIKTPPDDQNSAEQIKKVHLLLRAGNPLSAGGKWENAKLEHRNARLAPVHDDALRVAFKGMPKNTIDEARKLKDMPAGNFAVKPEDNPFAMRFDYVQNSREIANVLMWDAVLRAQDDDCDGAIESAMAILNTSQALKDQPFLVGLLVRAAEQAIAIGTIERTLGQGEVSEEKLKALQAMLEAQAAEDGLHAAMRGERATAHQTYKSLRDGRATFSEILGATTGKAGTGDRLLDLFPGVLLHGYPDFLRMMNEAVRASKLKDVERMEAFAKIDNDVRQKRRNLLMMMIMPATSKVADASQRVQAMMRCTITAVAVERYRLAHKNAWPRGLDDVVKAGLLKEIPRDPYDGQPLRLKRTTTGVVVYSVGYDKIDNAGKLDRNNPRAADTDMGFELFDRRGIAPILGDERPK